MRSVTGTGGGSRSDVWNQIKADVLGVPYTPVPGIECGTRGAAIVASVSLGHPPPPLPAATLGPTSEPDPGTSSTYRTAYEHYRWWAEHLVEGYRAAAQRASS